MVWKDAQLTHQLFTDGLLHQHERGGCADALSRPESRRALETPRVLQLDQQLIGVEMPTIDDRPHVVVVDKEQVGDG